MSPRRSADANRPTAGPVIAVPTASSSGAPPGAIPRRQPRVESVYVLKWSRSCNARKSGPPSDAASRVLQRLVKAAHERSARASGGPVTQAAAAWAAARVRHLLVAAIAIMTAASETHRHARECRFYACGALLLFDVTRRCPHFASPVHGLASLITAGRSARVSRLARHGVARKSDGVLGRALRQDDLTIPSPSSCPYRRDNDLATPRARQLEAKTIARRMRFTGAASVVMLWRATISLDRHGDLAYAPTQRERSRPCAAARRDFGMTHTKS